MIDDILAHIDKIGGESYHKMWVTYFTKDPGMQILSSNNTSAVVTFMIAFNYSPIPIPDVLNAVKQAKTHDELTKTLVSLFKFDDYCAMNTLFFFKTIIEFKNDKTQLIAEDLLKEYMIRGFILFSFHFNSLLNNLKFNISDSRLPEQTWVVFPDAVNCITSTKYIGVEEKITLMYSFYISIGDTNWIFSPSGNVALRNLLVQLLSILLPLQFLESDCNKDYTFEFLKNCIIQWSHCFDKEKDVEFFQLVQAFFSIVQSITATIRPEHIVQCITLACRIIYLLIQDGISNMSLFATCFNLIRVTRKMKLCPPDLYSKLVKDLLKYAITFPNFQLETINLPFKSDEPISFIPEQGFMFINYEAKVIVSLLQQYFDTVIHHSEEIIEFITEFLNNEKENKLKLSITALVACYPIGYIEYEALYKFLDSTFIEGVFKSDSDLNIQYRCALFGFMVHHGLKFPCDTLYICEWIKTVIEREGFQIIFYFVPLFRTYIKQKIVDFLDSTIAGCFTQKLGDIDSVHDKNELLALDTIVLFTLYALENSSYEIFTQTTSFIATCDFFFISQRYNSYLVTYDKLIFNAANRDDEDEFIRFHTSILNGVSYILMQINNDKFTESMVVELSKAFYDAFDNMKHDVSELIIDVRLMLQLAKLCERFSSKELFQNVINCLKVLLSKYQVIKDYLVSPSAIPIYTALSEAKLSDIDETTIKTMRGFLFAKYTNEITPDFTITVPTFLFVILRVIQDTEFEDKEYDFLCESCQINLANSYLLFRSNVINVLVKRLTKNTVVGALNLFKIIASDFFSPLALRDVIKSISQMSSLESQQSVVEKINEIFHQNRRSSVSSFFHFSGNESIKGPWLQDDSLTYPFSITTAIRLSQFYKTNMPIITIATKEKKLITILAFRQALKVNICVDGHESQYSFSACQLGKWQNIFLRFNANELQAFDSFGNLINYNITLPPLEKQLRIRVGVSKDKDKYFTGDIGPVFVCKSTDFETSNKEGMKAMETHEPPKNCIFSCIPCNTNDKTHRLHGTTQDLAKRAKISAVAVPFLNTILDVLKYDSTYSLILPLFLTAKSPQLLNELMVLLTNIINSDEYLQQLWKDIGSFKLFSAVLANIDPKYFNHDFANTLSYLFLKLPDDLKKDLADNILFNFPLLYQKGHDFVYQIHHDILPHLMEMHRKVFEYQTHDYIIYSILQTAALQPYKFEFDGYESFTASKLSELNLDALYPYSLDSVFKMFEINPNYSSMIYLFFTAMQSTSISLQQSCLLVLEKILLIHEVLGYPFANLAKAFDRLADFYLNNPSSILRAHALRVILALLKNDEKLTPKVNNAIMCMVNGTEKFPVDKNLMDSIVAFCFGKNVYEDTLYCDEGHEFVAPQFLLLIFKYIDTTDYQDFITVISGSMFNYTSSLAPMLEMRQWLFLFLKYINKIGYDVKLFTKVLFESLKIKTDTYELLFNPISRDMLESALDSIYSQIQINCIDDLMASKLAKLSCMFLAKYHCPEIAAKAAKLLGHIFTMDLTASFSIGYKKINIANAFPSLCGMYHLISPFNEVLTKLNYDNSVLELARQLYNNPLKDIFECHEYDVACFFVDKINIDENSLQNFTAIETINEKTFESLTLQTKKLFLSFLRLIKTDGGPWNVVEPTVHWRYSTRVNIFGENVFMRRDLNFDDHKKASAARDSAAIEEEDSIDNNVRIKKISALSFVPDLIELRKSISSYSVTLRKLSGFYKGHLRIFPTRIIFDGVYSADAFGADDTTNNTNTKFIELKIADISYIFRRFYMHSEMGVEIFTKMQRSYLFYFSDCQNRQNFEEEILKLESTKNVEYEDCFTPFRKATGSIVQTISSDDLTKKSKITEQWRDHMMCNYHYLYLLNILGGRSLNDISQFPVFPWVIADYERAAFDVNDHEFYRDFSKPIGALSEKRLANLEASYQMVDDPAQKCLYRSNMSNASSVCGFLIRTEPFTTLHIRLQDGKFDHPGRLFASVQGAWKAITTLTGDYRELIPHFYTTPYFLNNSNNFDLGSLQTGVQLNNVELPPWAESPSDFVYKMRYALESMYVSMHLNEWIDLVFGTYQKSEAHKNVFHPFSYHESISMKLDETQTALMQNHCANFGCLPTKLFSSTHATRSQKLKKSLTMRNSVDIIQQLPKEASMSKLTQIDSSFSVLCNDNTPLLLPSPPPIFFDDGVLVTSRGAVCVHLENPPCQFLSDIHLKIPDNSLIVLGGLNNQTLFYCQPQSTYVVAFSLTTKSIIGRLTHNSCVVDCITSIGGKYIVTGGSDSVLYVWNAYDLSKIAAMQFHSFQIQSVSGILSLDAIASVDSSNTVFITSITERRLRNSFTFNAPPMSSSIIKVTERGEVVVSTYNEVLKTSSVSIFDLYGNAMNKLEYPLEVTKIETMLMPDFQVPIFIISRTDKIIALNTRIDGTPWIAKSQMHEIKSTINPIGFFMKNKKIIYLTTKGEVKYWIL